MLQIEIVVFIPYNCSIKQEERQMLLQLPVGLNDTAIFDPLFRTATNSEKYRLLFSVSLSNTNMQAANHIMRQIATILKDYFIWIQYLNINFSSKKEIICEGGTGVRVLDCGEEVYSLDGCFINGTDLYDVDCTRKEIDALDYSCTNRDKEYIEIIDGEEQVHLRLFDEKGKTIFILDGVITKDVRIKKTNYYLLPPTQKKK